jgi:vesicle-associated membrane protein 7
MGQADEEFGRRIPFVFLDDIQNRFQTTYGQRGKGAIAYVRCRSSFTV